MRGARLGYRKYNNIKVEADGRKFDSKKEYRRYQELKILEERGEISNLQCQVKFELAEAVREADSIGVRGGKIKGRVILPSVSYIADFVYFKDGKMIVEDTKSEATKTPVYEVKKKWFYQKYKILISEV